jgi:hypothetical protein
MVWRFFLLYNIYIECYTAHTENIPAEALCSVNEKKSTAQSGAAAVAVAGMRIIIVFASFFFAAFDFSILGGG